jgi:hypothetical protein
LDRHREAAVNKNKHVGSSLCLLVR